MPTSSLFPALSREGCALLHQSEAHSLPFQPVAHSLCVYPGWHPEHSSVFCRLLAVGGRLPISFIRNTYSRPPCFNRNWPKSSARNSFRCNTYRLQRRNPFIRNTCKKAGGGASGGQPSSHPLPRQLGSLRPARTNAFEPHGSRNTNHVPTICFPAALGQQYALRRLRRLPGRRYRTCSAARKEEVSHA
jgi:hypothetical protein